MVRRFEIAGRPVGPGAPCFFIAEAGVNHDGDLNRAFDLIDGAMVAGVDAVKFQTFSAARLALASAPKAKYQKDRQSKGRESQFDMLKRLELSREDHSSLIERCNQKDLMFLSSPFDEESADLIETLGVPAFKIPSGELTNLPFLAHIAQKGRPMIVSTGMAEMKEVEAAVRTIKDNGDPPFALLHCVSAYPADPVDCNLKAMDTLREAFDVPIGWSDHTMGVEATLAAVAREADIIEKHFTLSRSLPGPDHKASMEIAEMVTLMRAIRVVEATLGDGEKAPRKSEFDVAAVARKSLVSVVEIMAGEVLSAEMVSARRPGTGIPVDRLQDYVGRKLKTDIASGQMLTEEMFEPEKGVS